MRDFVNLLLEVHNLKYDFSQDKGVLIQKVRIKRPYMRRKTFQRQNLPCRDYELPTFCPYSFTTLKVISCH